MILIRCKNIWKMMCNDTVAVTLLLILITSCLVLTGNIVQKQEKSQKKAEEFQEQYGDMEHYWTAEALDDLDYNTYLCDDTGKLYDKLSNIRQLLWSEEQFQFYTCCTQPIEIKNKIEDIFLYGYEQGNTECSVQEIDGIMRYTTKCLLVSEKFFDCNNIKIKTGRGFEEEDYQYNKGENVPVLLGSAYEEYYNIGDCIQAEYLNEDMTLQVVGFLDSDMFFISGLDQDFTSTERYIILPAFRIDELSDFSQLLSMDELNGGIASQIGISKTEQICYDIIRSQGVTWNISIVNPETVGSMPVIGRYSKMTKQIAGQFKILVVLVTVFATVALILNMFSILRKNKYQFGIEMLCGSSYKGIFVESFGLVFAILLVGDMWASLILKAIGMGLYSLIFIQLLVGAVLIITCVSCYFYMKKMEIGKIIGGTE